MYRRSNILPLVWGLLLFGWFTGYAMLSISVGVFIFLSLLWNAGKLKDAIKKTKIVYHLPLILFLIGVLSITWTIDKQATYRGIEKNLSLVAVLMGLAFFDEISYGTFSKISSITRFLTFLFALFHIGFSIFKYLFLGYDEMTFFYHPLVEVFDNHAIYVSIWVAYSLFSMKRISNWLDILIGCILLVFLILLASKIIIVSTILLISIRFVYHAVKKRSWKNILLASTLLLLVSSAIVFFEPVRQRFNEEFTQNVEFALTKDNYHNYHWKGVSLRLFQARIFFEILKEKDIFWTGLGLNATQKTLDSYYEYYGLYVGFKTYNFHNQYIQTFAELGVFGFAFLVISLLSMWYYAFTSKKFEVLGIATLLVIAFLTESFLLRERGIVLFAMFFGLIMKLNSSSNDDSSLLKN